MKSVNRVTSHCVSYPVSPMMMSLSCIDGVRYAVTQYTVRGFFWYCLLDLLMMTQKTIATAIDANENAVDTISVFYFRLRLTSKAC